MSFAMTYLLLAQRLASECGVGQSATTDVPTAVTGQVGELKRVCNWIRDSYREIQGDNLYQFLWERSQTVIPAGTAISALTTGVTQQRWDTNSAFYLPAGQDRFYLDYLPWKRFDATFTDQQIAANSQLKTFSIRPDNFMVVDATVLANTTVVCDRYKNPVDLVASTDIPLLPDDLHMLIVYEAIVRYANFDEAGSLRATSMAMATSMKHMLNERCLPTITLGDPLGE